MTAIDRRDMLLAGLGLVAVAAGPRALAARASAALEPHSTYGVMPLGGIIDQTATLQAAADKAAFSGTPLFLQPGIYATRRLELKSGTRITGVPGQSILLYREGGALLGLTEAKGVRLEGLVLDGAGNPLGGGHSVDGGALIVGMGAEDFAIAECRLARSSEAGIVLRRAAGSIVDCEIADIAGIGLMSGDAAGLEIARNHIHDCREGGILIWRSTPSDDRTIVSNNRIERIAATNRVSGRGNGVKILHAGSVLVTGNRITDCTSAAIRASSGANCQMLGNSCERLGEVALYAEFGCKGTVIANNIVDKAATGIAVTGFDERGRPVVVQGNLLRNLFFRKDTEPHGDGIAVEANATVHGNVVENAPGFGIVIGRSGPLRDVAVTANLIRNAHIGIGIPAGEAAGRALIAENMISGVRDGAIRAINGWSPVGPDLARVSAEAFGNLSVYANFAC
jgi:uncharacterized secreted repeat protein (TIGR03808 family)